MNYFYTGGDLFQWDIGRKVTLALPDGEIASVVEFTINNEANALVVDVKGNEAEIPNILLQTAGGLRMWAVTVTADGRQTRRYGSEPVYGRAKPDDYVYTETEVKRYEDFEERIKALEENGVGGGGGAVESVNGKTGKVTLNAEDVGAIPDADGAVQSNHLGSMVVKNANIAYGAVSDSRIAEKTITFQRLSDACVEDVTKLQYIAQQVEDELRKIARDNIAAASQKDVERLTEEKANKPDYAAYGLPMLYLTGDTTGMTKDDAVTLDYVYGERSGTCSCKWQGSSSIAYDKKNYTIKFDTAFEAADGWGAQKKYCFKANYIDHSHARNIVNAKLWGQIVKSRSTVPDRLVKLVNGGAIDGFPCIIMLNGEFHGLYTWNIPKDGWMLGMGEGGSMITVTDTLVDVDVESGSMLTVSGETPDAVTLVHNGKNFMPGLDVAISKYNMSITSNSDGSLTLSGINTTGGTAYLDLFDFADHFYLPAGTYMLSGIVPHIDEGVGFFITKSSDNGIVARLSGDLTQWRIVLEEGTTCSAYFAIPNGVTIDGTVSLQIEPGIVVTDFEKSARTKKQSTLPITISSLDGKNYLYATTGDTLTVASDGGEKEVIICASGNSPGFTIEGFKQTVSEWDTGFDLEYIADESDEGKVAAMQSLNNLITACINSDGTDLDHIGTMLDWDSAIDYYIFATMIAGHDMQVKNYLLYTFDGVKWYFGGYDMDCTYGLHWNGGSWVAAHFPARFDTLAEQHRLFYLIKNYKKAEVKARYAEIKGNVMSENNIYLMFSDFVGKIPSNVYLEDAKRWPMIPNTSVNSIYQILNYYRMRLPGCDIWVESQHR